MSEEDVIKRTSSPSTTASLAEDFRRLGCRAGMVLLVHSSLSSIGWVVGGAAAVILALEEVVRPFGTIVMPTHSGDYSDPSGWVDPPVPESWWEGIRRSLPPFDPDLTPTRGMGRVPECFRGQEGVLRSRHPQFSFAAWGERSIEILTDHSYDFGLGDDGPLGRIYALEGWVLLLGVDHSRNTSLHLAEFRAHYPTKREVACSAPVLVEGHRRWKSYNEVNYDSSDFGRIGDAFEEHQKQQVLRGRIGQADSRLFPQRQCVDYAVGWIERHRR